MLGSVTFGAISVWTTPACARCNACQLLLESRNTPRCGPVPLLKNQAGSKPLSAYKLLPRLLCSALNLAHTRILAGQARPELTEQLRTVCARNEGSRSTFATLLIKA